MRLRCVGGTVLPLLFSGCQGIFIFFIPMCCFIGYCCADSVECADLCALSVSLAQSQQRILASYAAPSSSAAVAASTSLEARLFESDTRMVAALQRQMHAVHAMLRSSSSATA